MKSETTRVLATPKGSLVLESYSTPRWTKKQGTWRQIDTTVRVGPDGVVGPVATLVDVSFSAGGSGPAVRLPVNGGQVSLTWPGALPAPRLEGDSAVYESVLPGVDLRLRALTDGFTWVLVVKSAEAAANPALDELRLGLDTAGGLTKRSRRGGGFDVVDASGATVVSAGGALMWDSSGLTSASRATQSRALSEFAADEKRDVVRFVPDRSRKAELPTSVQAGDLVIRPDLSLLRGKRTAYPVVIDPWTTIDKSYWGYAGSQNATRDDGVARVGLDPDGSGTYRSYFRFNLSGLSGKTLRSAKFLTEMTHSWDCDDTPVNLWRTADLLSSGKQSWSGPGFQLWLEQQYGRAHKPSGGAGCPNDPQPDMPMEFSSSNLETDISNNMGDSNYTLALSTRQSDGTSETTSNWWKKFDPALTKLSVEYNTGPNTPTAAQLSTHADYTAPAQPCTTGDSRPIVRASAPWFKAILTDPDGSNGGSLSGIFSLQVAVRVGASEVWLSATGWPKTVPGVAPGAKAEVQSTTSSGSGKFRWQVQTTDTLGGVSGSSPWCEFTLDMWAPKTPAVTAADGLYLESPPLGTNQDVHGSPGYSGQFTFSANGATDVYDYTYQVNGGPVSSVRASGPDGSVTVWVTPNRRGENVLTVRSRDQAGNASAPYDYVFLVDGYSAPKAHWAMDDDGGITLANQVAGAPTATLVNGPTWQDGRILGTHKTRGKDSAVKFDGADDHATATGVAVDTTRSYSVAAWVRPDADGLMEIAGAPGTATDSFMLRKWGDNRWVFTVVEQDVGSSAFTNVFGPAAVNGQWTHVAGAYDQADGKMRLYVNGKEVASATVPRTFNPGGLITLGRERWNSTDVGYWNGAIGEVRAWDRVIDPDTDLQPLMKPVLAGKWEMEDWDEEAPRQEGDGSGYQRPLTLVDAPAAQWSADGYNFSSGLALDGVSGSADSSLPVVRTDQSWTVAAWVRSTSTSHQAFLAQDGGTRSAFYLMLDGPTQQWVVTIPSSDGGTATWQPAFSTTPVTLNTWVHLVAVYDAPTKTLKLYVNGDLKSTRANTTAWHAGSTFHVGRSRGGNYTAGTVDRVRVWVGALTDADIAALYLES